MRGPFHSSTASREFDRGNDSFSSVDLASQVKFREQREPTPSFESGEGGPFPRMERQAPLNSRSARIDRIPENTSANARRRRSLLSRWIDFFPLCAEILSGRATENPFLPLSRKAASFKISRAHAPAEDRRRIDIDENIMHPVKSFCHRAGAESRLRGRSQFSFSSGEAYWQQPRFLPVFLLPYFFPYHSVRNSARVRRERTSSEMPRLDTR